MLNFWFGILSSEEKCVEEREERADCTIASMSLCWTMSDTKIDANQNLTQIDTNQNLTMIDTSQINLILL